MIISRKWSSQKCWKKKRNNPRKRRSLELATISERFCTKKKSKRAMMSQRSTSSELVTISEKYCTKIKMTRLMSPTKKSKKRNINSN